MQFKTNINCGGCKASVQPYLDDLEGVDSWEVDTNDKNKILTVTTDQLREDQIIRKIEEAGFEAKPHKPGVFDKLFKRG